MGEHGEKGRGGDAGRGTKEGEGAMAGMWGEGPRGKGQEAVGRGTKGRPWGE